MEKELTIKIAEYVEQSQKHIDALEKKASDLATENKELKSKLNQKQASWDEGIHQLAGTLKARGIISDDKVVDFTKSAKEDKQVLIRFAEKLAGMVQYKTFGVETDEIEDSGSNLDSYEYLAKHNTMAGYSRRTK